MKYFILLVFICIVSCTNTTSPQKFSFKKNNPLEFLEFLSKNRNSIYTIVKDSIPENWISLKHVEELLKHIDSEKRIRPVISSEASFYYGKEKLKNYEALEAYWMLRTLKENKKYPPNNRVHQLKTKYFKGKLADLDELKVWSEHIIDSLSVNNDSSLLNSYPIPTPITTK